MRLDWIGKKGAGEDIAWPEIIFIILLLAFMAVFFIFARNAVGGSLIEEEVYAKKIALLLDEAKPNTTIFLDFSDINDIAVKSGEKRESFRSISKLDTQNHSVRISLRLGNAGYTYSYFSDYNISDGWGMYNDKNGNLRINYILKVGEHE